MRRILFILAAVALAGFSSCSKDSQSTGTEYAPQMYHTIAYEPYSSVVDTSSEYYNVSTYNNNSQGKRGVVVSNMRRPVTGTIARKMYAGTPRTEIASTLYMDPYLADSLDLAGRELKNPIALTPEVLKEGEAAYLRYCSACHGANGQGNGKVAEQYKGVPSYNAGRVAKVSGGHIYHVITYGKGRMWPHGPLVNPEDRWKIVHFVQTLQKQK
jgi:mono/diheme cytochrome c family protein